MAKDPGLFNASDKVAVALEILLEWRELFKRGVPVTLIIESKLNALVQTTMQAPSASTLEYITDILYSAFYCFELLAERDLDSVICGICGTIGEVYFGDGNEKNCCSVAGIDYRPDSKPESLLSFDNMIERITTHFVEMCSYTRAENKLSIHVGEVPPVIAPAMRAAHIVNTELQKKSVYLTNATDVEGDPALLHLLIQQQLLNIDGLAELDLEAVQDICKKCLIATQNRSLQFLKGRILALYADILVGNSPCHKFTHVPGHSGGFYHFVCPHRCTAASKFLLLQESVRDAADLYLSLKYPPVLFICDTPCGMARHMDRRCPDVAQELWGDSSGCFEKPSLDKVPSQVSLSHLATSTYAMVSNEPCHYGTWQHPISGITRRYIAGDRFHTSTNPHKSPLCIFHDINLLEQSNCIKTSYQESLNHQKNKRLQSSTMQGFFVHYLYNYLMDFYSNEKVVNKQRRDAESQLAENQLISRDEFKRFIITAEQ